ncbi:hypothetical protein ALP10_02546 [Pseudomonas syringae pv. helianthi]|uniref:Uncharacterized protein n=1 Tax=Pseudomonas syringae pv. helianthi TaxID=251654 RepID=A0A3M6D9E9_9PSED|nr:hypothetical protein [Pseudomonas syringae group genomosp. 7]RMV52156.1 hypothetical protein ALP10_02546 [Pseudomonas syringae pv. helianthi]
MKKAYGRLLSDFGTLQPAERELLRCCRLGIVARISPEKPAQPTPENCIRARFLRFMALGGEDNAPVHDLGVQLSGAYVKGYLNLKSIAVPVSLSLRSCTVENTIVLTDAKFAHSLVLFGSTINGLVADRVQVKGLLSLGKTISNGKIT